MCVTLARSPTRSALVQLGPRRANDEQRHVLRPLGEMLDEGEQGFVGPVQVLEDKYRFAARRQASRSSDARR